MEKEPYSDQPSPESLKIHPENMNREELLNEISIQIDTEMGIANQILQDIDSLEQKQNKSTSFDTAKKEVYLSYRELFKDAKDRLSDVGNEEAIANILIELDNKIKEITYQLHQPMQEFVDLVKWAKDYSEVRS